MFYRSNLLLLLLNSLLPLLRLLLLLVLNVLVLLRLDQVAPIIVDQDKLQVPQRLVVVVAAGGLLLLAIYSGVLIRDAHGRGLFQSINNLQHLLVTKEIVDISRIQSVVPAWVVTGRAMSLIRETKTRPWLNIWSLAYMLNNPLSLEELLTMVRIMMMVKTLKIGMFLHFLLLLVRPVTFKIDMFLHFLLLLVRPVTFKIDMFLHFLILLVRPVPSTDLLVQLLLFLLRILLQLLPVRIVPTITPLMAVLPLSLKL
jgi:hypothetical protein